jgi:hypothetical protein
MSLPFRAVRRLVRRPLARRLGNTPEVSHRRAPNPSCVPERYLCFSTDRFVPRALSLHFASRVLQTPSVTFS